MHMQHTVADAERVGHNLNHRRRSHVPPLLPLSAPLFFTYITHRARTYTKLKPAGTLEVKMDSSTTCQRGWLSQSTCVVSYNGVSNFKSKITVPFSLSLQTTKTSKAKVNRTFLWQQFLEIYKGSVLISPSNGNK